MVHHVANDVGLHTGLAEVEDVADHHDDVESVRQLHCRKIADRPYDHRRFRTGLVDHVGIKIDGRHRVASSFEFDGQTTGPTASVENATRATVERGVDQTRNRVGFTVNVVAPCGHGVESLVILVEVDSSAPLRPPCRHSLTRCGHVETRSRRDRTRRKSAPSWSS